MHASLLFVTSQHSLTFTPQETLGLCLQVLLVSLDLFSDFGFTFKGGRT